LKKRTDASIKKWERGEDEFKKEKRPGCQGGNSFAVKGAQARREVPDHQKTMTKSESAKHNHLTFKVAEKEPLHTKKEGSYRAKKGHCMGTGRRDSGQKVGEKVGEWIEGKNGGFMQKKEEKSYPFVPRRGKKGGKE